MGTLWLWLVALVAACASAVRGGSSLRGALEALQRRQRSRQAASPPIAPPTDYDALYEFFPPQAYADPDYGVDLEGISEDPNSKYIIKLLDDNERSPEAYEYKIIKKKKSVEAAPKQESAFRERSHHSDNDRLQDLFLDRNDAEDNKVAQSHAGNDAEYALLLGQLWSKYKNNRPHNEETSSQGVVKLYKDKVVKKRYPDNWGPVAFKKKRSSDSEVDRPIIQDYEERRLPKARTVDPNYNSYETSDDEKDDTSEEYAIAFQPLDDESLVELNDDDQYRYETVQKRFPVAKRSGSYNFMFQKKRFTSDQDKRDTSKRFRSSSGTDPRILKDLSKLFGDSDVAIIKNPVKRSSDAHDAEHHDHHEGKPPNLSAIHTNDTHEHGNITFDDDSHEQQGHNLHHPGLSGKEETHVHDDHSKHAHSDGHAHGDVHDHKEKGKSIKLRKKSIDWSDYFGIDKRRLKNFTKERLKKQYFDTFNKETIYPQTSFHPIHNAKRSYSPAKTNEDTEIQIDSARAVAIHDDDKKSGATDNNSKLDNIDRKLRNMEDLIVDEALHISNSGEKLDSKEEQEMKEKLLSRLAAAYSFEKMRKALKEFKQSLQAQKNEPSLKASTVSDDESKDKRISIKKDTDYMTNEIPMFRKEAETGEDFEEEQGAGHYINGKIDEPISEGYMGGSGRHRFPVVAAEAATGSCPVLGKIIQRCRGVDMLTGDRGQLFLPLCSLHQICYLCGEAPPMTCDMVFLSEADTTCEGDSGCERAARSALMALRELHDTLADELDGECEASPCLQATLKLNIGWQRALQR